MNFISDCHDYIAVTHNRNYNRRCFKDEFTKLHFTTWE